MHVPISRTSSTRSSRRRIPRVAAGLVLTAGLTLAACGDDDTTDALESSAESISDGGELESEELLDAAGPSIEELSAALDDPSVSTLFVALEAAGFTDIAEAESFTFFAPNDGAFDQLDADLLAGLLEDPDQLQGILRDHLLDDVVMAADLPADGTVTSTGGLELQIDTSGETPTVNGIDIVRTDVTVDGGVIHVIDGLLLES